MPATPTVHQVHGPRGPVSTDTVRHRLKAAGLRNCRPYVGPIWTPPAPPTTVGATTSTMVTCP